MGARAFKAFILWCVLEAAAGFAAGHRLQLFLPRAAFVSREAVALTRERGNNEKLQKLLAEQGIETVEIPCIAHGIGKDRDKLAAGKPLLTLPNSWSPPSWMRQSVLWLWKRSVCRVAFAGYSCSKKTIYFTT